MQQLLQAQVMGNGINHVTICPICGQPHDEHFRIHLRAKETKTLPGGATATTTRKLAICEYCWNDHKQADEDEADVWDDARPYIEHNGLRYYA